MKKNMPCAWLFLIFILASPAKSFGAQDPLSLPVFPGALGFGSDTVAGSGRHLHPAKSRIFLVSSLADSGPGSLRECVEASMPRICLFEIAGAIFLKTSLSAEHPYLTISGQTAPGDGIHLFGAGLKIATHDVLVEHLSIRPGDAAAGGRPSSRDAITINGKGTAAKNILIDHVSLSWALDENVSTYGEQVSDVTISNSIISEGLYRSIHPDGPHSMGILIGEGSERISIHHCLLANNNDRNPRQKAGSTLEFVNNFVTNWGGPSGSHMANPSDTEHTDKKTELIFAGNVYSPGPDSALGPPIALKPPSKLFRAFVEKNIGPSRPDDTGSDWAIVSGPEIPFRASSPPFRRSGVKTADPKILKQQLFSSVGSRPARRNTVDARLLSEIQSGKTSLKDCLSGCERSVGGWPVVSTERRAIMLPKHPFADSNKNGYTDLEDYLHEQRLLLTGRSPL